MSPGLLKRYAVELQRQQKRDAKMLKKQIAYKEKEQAKKLKQQKRKAKTSKISTNLPSEISTNLPISVEATQTDLDEDNHTRDELDEFPNNETPLTVDQMRLAIFNLYYTIFVNTKIYTSSTDRDRIDECNTAARVCNNLKEILLTNYVARKPFVNIEKMKMLCDNLVNILVEAKFLDHHVVDVQQLLSTTLTHLNDATDLLEAYDSVVKAVKFNVDNFVIIQQHSPLNKFNSMGLSEADIEIGMRMSDDQYVQYIEGKKATCYNPNFLYENTPLVVPKNL